MDKPVDIQLLAPKAPGYLMAQTKFVLAGKPEDFAEWGDGTACDDYFRFDDKVFWTEDPSYWLLVFRVCPEKEGKWV